VVFFPFIQGSSQDIINEYARVVNVFNKDTTDVDSVEINTQIFEDGDTALFIMMKGADVYTQINTNGFPEFWGQVKDIRNTGIYNILLVYKTPGNYVIFTTKLRQLKTIKSGEVAQMVKIRGGQDEYLVDKPLTCAPWDPVTGTGGVFALIAGRKIILNSTIDVSGKGFYGADPSATIHKVPSIDYFTGKCSEAVDSFYTEAAADSAGRKGESFAYEGFPFTRGMLFTAFTGGGGGNGKYSGGGGGGNWGTGGQGGRESASCNPGMKNLGGLGNYNTSYYNTALFPNRIFMGGGGGTGTQNPDSNRFATKGGNGGGIVILITDTIEHTGADSGYIKTNGESVVSVASAGAGGGGGGGLILLDVTKYIGRLSFQVKGGDGGRTDNADATGPGGFGGGGVVWHSGGSFSGPFLNLRNGKPGTHTVQGRYGATEKSTQDGERIPNLKIPLSGFLFNVMPEDQDICEGDTPWPLIASNPKGGNGPGTYTYRWIQSYDLLNWANAPVPNTNKDYYPGPQTDTIYYKRIVYSGATTDTSLILSVNVLPKLENNNIAADDTICRGSIIPEIKDTPTFNIKGGDGLHTFVWEKRTTLTGWTNVGKTDTTLSGEIPLQTTYYRRIVNSHVCSLVSDSVTITVLPNIFANEIYTGSINFPDDTICENDNALVITGRLPGGGDEVYKYLWQSALDSVTWNPAKPPFNLQDYDPDTLKATRFYRRIVISGSDDVCLDTSNVVTNVVHPAIMNNLIDRDTIICMDDPLLKLIQRSGNVAGGDGTYEYQWESKAQTGTWQPAGKTDNLMEYEPGYIQDTTFYRRFVISGACEDYSETVQVIVQDSILNNMIADHDTICQDAVPAPLTGTVPTGGETRMFAPAYQWEVSLNSTSWAPVPGATQIGFSPPALTDTTFYRRKIISGKCMHYSDPVTIIVHSPITNNIIKNGSGDETCYETSLDLLGTVGIAEMTGGDTEDYYYEWQKSTNNLDWLPAPGAHNFENYTTEELLVPAYYRRYVVSGACSSISGSTHVLINPRPTAEILISDYLNECYDNKAGPVAVQVPFFATGTAPYRIISFDGFDYDTLANITTVGGNGNFTDFLTTDNTDDFSIVIADLMDGNGCYAYPDSLKGMVEMTVFKKPDISINGGEMVQVCDDMTQLEAIQDVGTGFWFKAEGDEYLTFDDPALVDVVISTQHGAGNSKRYVIYRLAKNWPEPEEPQCESRDTVEVIFWKPPEPADAGSRPGQDFDTTIYFADQMHLFAEPPTAGSGLWEILSGPASIQNDTLYNTLMNLGDQDLDIETEYQLRWTITNGICPVTSDEVKIIRKDLRVYDGFSPDGNYINEYFTIDGLDYADTWNLQLFSKSGNLIREFSKGLGEEGPAQDQIWDGTYDGGRPVESGIYYYILTVTKGDDTPYNYKGFVVITRERE
jgi:hypothetical protein